MMHNLKLLLASTAFAVSAHAAVLVSFPFDATPDTATTVEPGVTASQLVDVGVGFYIDSGTWRYQSGLVDNFSSSTDYVEFSLSSNTSDVFDLSAAGSGVTFGTDRIFSGNMQFRVVIWEGSDNTVVGNTPLYTGPTLATDNSNPDYLTGPIAGISAAEGVTDLYFQIQVADGGVNSSARLEDALVVNGSLAPVPEPSTYAFLAGLAALGLLALRRKR
jgi:hypothetical protein